MGIDLGTGVEQAVITAAGIQDLNIDPGSMQVSALGDPVTTVRFTLVVEVPSDAVRAAITAAITPPPAPVDPTPTPDPAPVDPAPVVPSA